jgi:hypothetical protein
MTGNESYRRQIFEALGAPNLDREKFERCVCDLLGAAHVPGGSDSGVDGLIPDPEGEYPLVITSGQRPAENLARSLDSYLKAGLPARKVAVATRLELTPARRHKLTEVAQQREFTITRSLTRHDLAGLLYRNREWAKDLLGLSGAPLALSKASSSPRPQVDLEPIGREDDAEWLRTTAGDRIVVGQPGSGKTFLLEWMIRGGWEALFLETEDGTEIANALRELAPRTVIVDDTHAHRDRLDQLFRLRTQGHEFDIVATAWEGARDDLLTTLNLTESKCRRLELLTRKQILQIYTEMGIPARIKETVRDSFLRDLVDQAANKPGLAVTIGTLWLQGGWQEILRGEALSRETIQFFEENVGDDSAQVLGCFSIGGKRGMRLESVRELLGLSRPQVWRIVTGLAAGGVLKDLREGTLAVEPEPLRSALLRAAFFPDHGPSFMNYERLLSSAISREHAIEALLQAKGRGAAIPDQELQQVVVTSPSQSLWDGLARLSGENALWVLTSYPGDVLDIASGALTQAGLLAITALLHRAAGTAEPRTGRAFEILSIWIKEPFDWKEAVRRRRLLAQAARDFARVGHDLSVAAQAIALSLTPDLQSTSVDPAVGDTVTIRWGLLPLEALRGIETIWNEFNDVFSDFTGAAWQQMRSALWSWIFPKHTAAAQVISPEVEQFTREFASRVLRDLSARAGATPGILAGLARLGGHLGVHLPRPCDPIFDLLFPVQETSAAARHERETVEVRELPELARRWSTDPPSEIADLILLYHAEAKKINYGPSRNIRQLSQLLARTAAEPTDWFHELVSKELYEPWAGAFLEWIVETRQPRWQEIVEHCLLHRDLSWTATEVVLTLDAPPRRLLSLAMDNVPGKLVLVEDLCILRRIPLSTLRILLQSTEPGVATRAAIGEWVAESGRIREQVEHEWRAAILGAKTEDYCHEIHAHGTECWLSEILVKVPGLALDWLRARLVDDDRYFSLLSSDSPFLSAVRALEPETRIKLLEEAKPSRILEDLLPALIGRDLELYKRWLSIDRSALEHLTPLRGKPDDAWKPLAAAALDTSYEPAQIASIALRAASDEGFVGSGLEHWTAWHEAFASLETDPDPRFHEIAAAGCRQVMVKIGLARDEQRNLELYGWRR